MIQFAGGGIELVFLLVIIILFALGAYKIWDSYQMEKSSVAAVYAKYKPVEPGARATFEELREINPEVVCWLTIYGTNIDYPVVQAKDNWKYLDKDVFGNYSLTGSLYLDRDNASDLSDFNSFIYGHNMTPKVMFGNVKDFRDAEYFATHRYGELYYNYEHYGLECFAVVEKIADDPEFYRPGIVDEEAKERYLQDIYAEALQSRSISVGTDDRILILSTCSPMRTNIRDILICKICDTTFEDEFKQKPNTPTIFGGVDGKSIEEFIKDIPIVLWLIILLLIILLIALAVLKRKKKSTHKEAEEDADD